MARECQRRQRVGWEDGDLEHLRPGAEVRIVGEPGAVCDSDHARRVALGDVIDAEQRRQLDRGANFFHALPHCCVGGMFIMVDESTR
jgi:hypothetical protein